MDNTDTIWDQLNEGKYDFHKRMAAFLFEKSPENITPEERRTGKLLNFALKYGCLLKVGAILDGIPRPIDPENPPLQFELWRKCAVMEDEGRDHLEAEYETKKEADEECLRRNRPSSTDYFRGSYEVRQAY